MAKMAAVISAERQQFVVYGLLALSVLAATAYLGARNGALYRPFFGPLPPLLAVGITAVIGAILLALLLGRGWFAIAGAQTGRGLLTAVLLASLFAIVIVLIDWFVVLPADLNRPYPDALPFYYSIAFVVEVIFHLLPLTLLLLGLTALSPSLTFEPVIWPVLIVVALLEPIFQTVLGFSRPYPAWVMVLVALNIFAFNVSGLALFKRYDFVSMFALRLAYYALWHIIWGVLRLRFLF